MWYVSTLETGLDWNLYEEITHSMFPITTRKVDYPKSVVVNSFITPVIRIDLAWIPISLANRELTGCLKFKITDGAFLRKIEDIFWKKCVAVLLIPLTFLLHGFECEFWAWAGMLMTVKILHRIQVHYSHVSIWVVVVVRRNSDLCNRSTRTRSSVITSEVIRVTHKSGNVDFESEPQTH